MSKKEEIEIHSILKVKASQES